MIAAIEKISSSFILVLVRGDNTRFTGALRSGTQEFMPLDGRRCPIRAFEETSRITDPFLSVLASDQRRTIELSAGLEKYADLVTTRWR
jgi:hypothetical protein